jgi:hypothetical protein
MNEYAAGLIHTYRQRGLVVDTNLLLLYFININYNHIRELRWQQ